jgi:hypothetical protein
MNRGRMFMRYQFSLVVLGSALAFAQTPSTGKSTVYLDLQNPFARLHRRTHGEKRAGRRHYGPRKRSLRGYVYLGQKQRFCLSGHQRAPLTLATMILVDLTVPPCR